MSFLLGPHHYTQPNCEQVGRIKCSLRAVWRVRWEHVEMHWRISNLIADANGPSPSADYNPSLQRAETTENED